MTEITLGLRERLVASMVGSSRRLIALRRNSHDSHGASELGWDEDIEGAAAEMCVAKHLGLYWSPETDVGDADLGTDIQVRWTPRHGNALIIRPTDKDHHVFFLVTGRMPHMRIRGFIRGEEAKLDEWLKAPGERPAAYFVPAEHLTPIEEFTQARKQHENAQETRNT